MSILVAMLLLVQQPINNRVQEEPRSGQQERPAAPPKASQPAVWGEDAHIQLKIWVDPAEIWDTDVITGLGNSFSEAAHLGLRYSLFGTDSHEQSTGMRVVRSAGSLLISQIFDLEMAGIVGYAGHARTYRNWGFDSIRLYELPSLAEKDADLDSMISDVWDVMIHDKEVAISGARSEWINDFWMDPERSAHFETLRVQAEAGHNNMNVAASRTHRRKILGGHGHPLDLSTLVAHQLSSVTEVFGGSEDIKDYAVDIANDGVHTTYERIRGLSWAAFLGSNTVISSVLKQFDYWGTGRTQVEIMEWELADGLWIGAPDFYLWLTTDGPAPMMEIPVRYGDHDFTFSTEYGFEKDSVEFSVSWRGPVHKQWSGEVNIAHNPSNSGYWIEVGPSYSLESVVNAPLTIGMLFFFGSGMTYLREQDAGQKPVELDRQESGVKFFAEYTLRF